MLVLKVDSKDEKLIWLGQNINNFEGSGTVYTGTKFNTEIYSKWLERLNIPFIAYNAGLDGNSRISIENGFMSNRWKCSVSTNAV